MHVQNQNKEIRINCMMKCKIALRLVNVAGIARFQYVLDVNCSPRGAFDSSDRTSSNSLWLANLSC